MGQQNSKSESDKRRQMACHYCYHKIDMNEPLVKVYSYDKLDGLIMCRKCLFSPTRRGNLEILQKDIKEYMAEPSIMYIPESDIEAQNKTYKGVGWSGDGI